MRNKRGLNAEEVWRTEYHAHLTSLLGLIPYLEARKGYILLSWQKHRSLHAQRKSQNIRPVSYGVVFAVAE